MSKKKTEQKFAAAVVLDAETGAILQQQPKYYNTSRNYRERRGSQVCTTEKNDGISLTTPNLAFTNREIIQRFASGIPIQGFLVPSYETDGSAEATDTFSMEEYRRMDHEEQAEFRQKILDKKHEAEKQLKLSAQKQIDARREAERQSWLKNQIDLLNKKKDKGDSTAPEAVS